MNNSLEKCVWKVLNETKNSSSFISAKEEGESNPLFKCYGCKGYELNCLNYIGLRSLDKYRK